MVQFLLAKLEGFFKQLIFYTYTFTIRNLFSPCFHKSINRSENLAKVAKLVKIYIIIISTLDGSSRNFLNRQQMRGAARGLTSQANV